MKSTFLSFTVSLVTSTVLFKHLLNVDTLKEAIAMSVICILGYAIGQLLFIKEFTKIDILIGILLGVFMGLVSQVATLYWLEKIGFIYLASFVVCLFPKQLGGLLLKYAGKKIEK